MDCVQHEKECDDDNTDDWDGCSASGIIGETVVSELSCFEASFSADCSMSSLDATRVEGDRLLIVWRYGGTDDEGNPKDDISMRTMDPVMLQHDSEHFLCALCDMGANEGSPSVAALSSGNGAVVVWPEKGPELDGCYRWMVRTVEWGIPTGFGMMGDLVCEAPWGQELLPAGEDRFRLVWRDGGVGAMHSLEFTLGGSVSTPLAVPDVVASDYCFPPPTVSGAVVEEDTFVLAWDTWDTCSNGGGWSTIHVEHFCPNLIGGNKLAALGGREAEQAFNPAVAAMGPGEMVMTYVAKDGTGLEGIVGRRFILEDSNGNETFAISPSVSVSKWSHGIAATGSGRFVAVWSEHDKNGEGAVFGRLFVVPGEPLGPAFAVCTRCVGSQVLGVKPVALSDGSFVIVWVVTPDASETPISPDGGPAILMQRFDRYGQKMWKNCGDGVCGSGETTKSCSKDCGL
jgi:hypothetical protein